MPLSYEFETCITHELQDSGWMLIPVEGSRAFLAALSVSSTNRPHSSESVTPSKRTDLVTTQRELQALSVFCLLFLLFYDLGNSFLGELLQAKNALLN